jgi:polysaccharide pyruvyl transferase WcaK-like protein
MTEAAVGIIAHAGNQNLGDEALVAAVIDAVRRHAPRAKICAFSMNSADTATRHGIPAFPLRRVEHRAESPGSVEAGGARWEGLAPWLRRGVKAVPWLRAMLRGARAGLRVALHAAQEPTFLVQSYGLLRGVDLLIVAGSQQLNDAYGGPWGFPYTLFKWSVLARLARTKVAFLSVGAGPINSPLSRWFVRGALSLARYRSYRDAISSRLVQGFGVPGDHPVAPDLVYGLRMAAAPARRDDTPSQLVVGANPVPFYDGRYWSADRPEIYWHYVQTLAAFADWLVQGGRRVMFFPTQLRADPLVIEDVRRLMKVNGGQHHGRLVPVGPIASLDDLAREIGRMDIVVANRYHGILIALLLNKPVIGLAYHRKSVELMTLMGQAPYAIDVSTCTPDLLMDRFSALEATATVVKRQIAERVAALRVDLERQYDQVFALLNGHQARGKP